MTNAVSLTNVSKRFGEFHAVKDVTLKIPLEQRCALLGRIAV